MGTEAQGLECVLAYSGRMVQTGGGFLLTRWRIKDGVELHRDRSQQDLSPKKPSETRRQPRVLRRRRLRSKDRIKSRWGQGMICKFCVRPCFWSGALIFVASRFHSIRWPGTALDAAKDIIESNRHQIMIKCFHDYSTIEGSLAFMFE